MNDRQSDERPAFDLEDPRLTEAFNPRTAGIDRAAPLAIVRMLNAEDRAVAEVVATQEAAIAGLIEEVADRICRGGRLFYVGAGTSGRLGVLDAAECPPTFGTDPEMVRGIVAGGPDALVRSQEGSEDDEEAGARVIRDAGVRPPDFVLGIATSGTTPFVCAALDAAAEAGAGTGFLSCTPPAEEVVARIDRLVTPLTGAEAIAGSTRLKAGTATKLVLNTLTTGVMIRLGKVYGNLMVDLRAVSRKLVDRSLRMVSAVTGADREEARALLIAAGGSVKTAIAMRQMGVGRFMAERRLDACDGFLGDALERFQKGAPVHYFSLYPQTDCQGWDRLLERLAAVPARVTAAVGATRDERRDGFRGDSATVCRSGAEIAWHLDHLIRYEREAIRPRLESWPAGDEQVFSDWNDESAPGPAHESADLDKLEAEFRAEREETLAVLTAVGPSLLERHRRLGAETFTGYQFLRGIAQHDEAHVERIGERLHRALFEEAE